MFQKSESSIQIFTKNISCIICMQLQQQEQILLYIQTSKIGIAVPRIVYLLALIRSVVFGPLLSKHSLSVISHA